MTNEGESPRSLSTETQRSPEIVRPDVFNTVLLDEIASGIQQVLEALERTRPKGRVVPISRTISGTSLRGERLRPYWFSFHLINDGPDTLEFAVNGRTEQLCSLRSGVEENTALYRSEGSSNGRDLVLQHFHSACIIIVPCKFQGERVRSYRHVR